MKRVAAIVVAAVVACAIGCVVQAPEQGQEAAMSSPPDRAVDNDTGMISAPVDLGGGSTQDIPPACGASHMEWCTFSTACGACQGPNHEPWRYAGFSKRRCDACGCDPCPFSGALCQSC